MDNSVLALEVHPAIEALRTATFDADAPPATVEQFVSLAEGIALVSESRSELEALCGMDTSQLATAVVELAGHMLKSVGDPNVTPGAAYDEAFGNDDVLPLPGMCNTVVVTPSKKRQDAPRQEVVIPSGFSPEEIGRDITRSVAALVALRPTAADVQRFYNRRYTKVLQPLTFEMTSTVWAFARLGRLDGLANVSQAESFVRNAVGAWDTLAVARRDAMNGLAVLVGDTTDAVELAAATTALRPVWETEASRFSSFVASGLIGSKQFDRERSWLRRRVAAGQLVVADVASLNQGQVLRICQAAGLDTDAINRVEETSIRTGLAELGLAKDADQLVALGVRATRAGLREAFWDACRRRAVGDTAWDSELQLA
jgi:hypothetical protein